MWSPNVIHSFLYSDFPLKLPSQQLREMYQLSQQLYSVTTQGGLVRCVIIHVWWQSHAPHMHMQSHVYTVKEENFATEVAVRSFSFSSCQRKQKQRHSFFFLNLERLFFTVSEQIITWSIWFWTVALAVKIVKLVSKLVLRGDYT